MNYINYSKPIQDLIECFKKIPGVGEKSAERMALWTIECDEDFINNFSDALINCKKNIKRCAMCNNFCINNICDICNDEERDNNTLCVVEKPKNIVLFEKTGSYKGKYFVLDTLISSNNYCNNNIDKLIKKIDENNIKEVILAFDANIDGEVTSLYISKLLESKNVLVSKIAHGVPLGADMDYLDLLTLETALNDRKQING